MPRLTRTYASLCSLAVALALLALATTARKDAYHLISHHQQRPPHKHHEQDQAQAQAHQHQHHHEPTLAGALFPVADEVLAGEEYVKEPCPTACVHHRSDIYLAVTSIGEGFPRVQFTCSHAHPSGPTGAAQHPEGNHHHHYQHDHGYSQGGNSNTNNINNNNGPADPIPEYTPRAPAHGCEKCSHHEPHDRTDGANIYTGLHITTNPHLKGSTPMDCKNDNNAAGFLPHYDFIVSPRERQSADLGDDAESHTTTMTFSDDNNKNHHNHDDAARRSVPLTADQDPHNQVHILPVRDHHDRHRHVVSSGSVSKAGDSGAGAGATTPEPVATLVAPTSLESGSNQGQGQGHGQGWNNEGRMVSKGENSASVRKAFLGYEYQTGPAAPIPEPLPGQTHGHTQTHYHHQDQGDRSVGGKERAGQDQDGHPALWYRTIVHRVTTLIIETETIVNRATPTPTATAKAFMQGSEEAQHHHHRKNNNKKGQDGHGHHLHEQQHRRDPHAYGLHAGDHIMFDAGVDGDMVVSIASSEHSSRRNNKAAPH
ncbi:hypothetical protein BGW39_004366 [Mortierella sp. 14UC]|nr:hypothetical protein BGW39_004366 [Mortierella sp. 14UC]